MLSLYLDTRKCWSQSLQERVYLLKPHKIPHINGASQFQHQRTSCIDTQKYSSIIYPSIHTNSKRYYYRSHPKVNTKRGIVTTLIESK